MQLTSTKGHTVYTGRPHWNRLRIESELDSKRAHTDHQLLETVGREQASVGWQPSLICFGK